LKDLIYQEILLYHFPKRLEQHIKLINTGKSFIDDVLTSIHAAPIYDDEDDDYDENGL